MLKIRNQRPIMLDIWSGVSFHNISPSEYSIWSLVRNLDLEGEPVPDPDGLHLLLPGIKDPDPGGWGLGGGGDADHVRVPDRHHAEGDVLAARVVCASDLWRDNSDALSYILGCTL